MKLVGAYSLFTTNNRPLCIPVGTYIRLVVEAHVERFSSTHKAIVF